MLTETITNSIRTIEQLRRQRENKATAEQFSANLTKLRTCVTETQKTLDCAEELRACHISETPVLTKAVLDELWDAVNECGMAISDGSLNADKVRLLEFHAKTAKQEVSAVWNQDASALVELRKSRLAILRGLSADGPRIRDLENNMQNALTSPVTRERIRSFAQDVAVAKRIADNFPLDADIEDFLQKVFQRRATLADLTPEILTWLRKYGFQRKFQIVNANQDLPGRNTSVVRPAYPAHKTPAR